MIERLERGFLRPLWTARYFILALVLACPVTVAAQSDAFKSNLGTFQPDGEAEKAVLEIISKNLKTGYESIDAEAFGQALSPTFKRAILTKPDLYLVFDRAAVLSGPHFIGATGDSRAMNVNLKGISASSSNSQLVASGLVTYESPHFRQRYLFSQTYTKDGPSWKMGREILVPVQSTDNKTYEAKLYLVKQYWSEASFVDHFIVVSKNKGPDHAIHELEQNQETERVGLMSAVVVFRDPPPAGSTVTVVLSFTSTATYRTYKYDFEYPIESYEPFTVIETIAQPINGPIKIDLFLDKAAIATKKF